jgi:hypothetical protein
MLAACGSDNGSPPSLKNSDIGFISPFDTIVAEFNSKIVDINKLEDEDNIKTSQLISMINYKDSKGKVQTTSNKLYFVGINDTASCGLTHLKQNKRDSIVLSNLKNEDGYIQKKAVLKFSTYPIFDDEDYDESNPGDLKNLGLGVTTDEVTFAGVIGLDTLTEWVDFNDYFKLSLKAYDSLYVKLSNTKNTDVNLGLMLPLKNKDSTLVAIVDNKTKTKAIVYEMDPRGFDVNDFITPVEFKIKVSSRGDLTPYLLWVKIVENKR